MNTNHIITKEQFITFQAKFKELARNKSITASDIMLYNIIRGYPIDRGFTDITNKNKLWNGCTANQAFRNTKTQLKYLMVHRPKQLVERFNNFVEYVTVEQTGKTYSTDELKHRCHKLYELFMVIE